MSMHLCKKRAKTWLLLLASLTVLAPGAQGKGREKLAPTSPETAADSAEDKAAPEKAKKKAKSGSSASGAELAPDDAGAAAAKPPSPLSLKLKDHLVIATSFGPALVRRAGVNWGAGGSGGFGLTYKLPQPFMKGELAASLRYAATDVSPTLTSGVKDNQAFRGILEAYLVGANWQRPLKPKLTATIAAELGLVSVHLNDLLGLTEAVRPLAIGGLLVASGGLDWQARPNFRLGPRLRLGLGSFVSAELGLSAAFAF